MKWNVPIKYIGLSGLLMHCSSPNFSIAPEPLDSTISDSGSETHERLDSAICESSVILCERWGKNCDSFKVTDSCGVERTVNCGVCKQGKCGSSGRAGVCGSTVSYDMVSTESITSVWSASSGEAWLVNNKGATARWNGTWGALSPVGASGVNRLWGIDINNIWMVSASDSMNSIAYWNGTDFQFIKGFPLLFSSVSGTSRNDVWAVGNNGVILHKWGDKYDDWKKADVNGFSEDLLSVSSVSPTAAYTVGKKGSFGYWDGNTWQFQTLGTTEDLKSVWARATNEIWVVGTNGTVLKQIDTEWISMPIKGISVTFNQVWGTSSNDIWIVGDAGTLLHWDGLSWTRSVLTGVMWNLLGIAGSGGLKDPIWVYGDSNELIQLKVY